MICFLQVLSGKVTGCLWTYGAPPIVHIGTKILSFSGHSEGISYRHKTFSVHADASIFLNPTLNDPSVLGDNQIKFIVFSQ